MVVDHLQKSPFDGETTVATPALETQIAAPEQGHHRRVMLKNSNFTIECGRDDGIHFALEEDRLG